MRFNAYFVRLAHSQEDFSGNVQVGGASTAVHFKRIAAGLFAAHFKSQVELAYGQELAFKNARGSFTVLLPVLSQYNQRKLRKITELLQGMAGGKFREIVLALLDVENFLELEGLLYFFSLPRHEAVAVLTELELASRVKVINLNYLFITSWDHYLHSFAAMKEVLHLAYEARERTVKFARLEKAVHIPQESVFFKYLLKKCMQDFPCRELPGALVFTKLPLSDEEMGRMAEIEKVLRASKLPLFTFENVQKNTAYTLRQINDALWAMLNDEKILQLDERHFIFSDEYGKIINRLKKFKRNQGDIMTFDDLRALTAYSRKYLIVLFEYWDAQQITKRLGNKRQILLGA